MENKNAWEKYPEGESRQPVNEFAKEYRRFLSNCKTERECVQEFEKRAIEAGFMELSGLIGRGEGLKAGDKVYVNNMGKAMALFIIGKQELESGMNILGAHIDSPRLDIKQVPLYEDTQMAMLDTHYYGGVKKYQWVALPLALHGVVVKKDGTTIEMNIGENDDDPVFFISDLLVHLAGEQMEKKASKVIEGEALDLIIGSKPIVLTREEKEEDKKEDKEKAKEAIKAGILDILKASYDMEEEDFLSAELEIVPAGRTREVGFDRSMILGYGQDDRVCAFTSMRAMLDVGATEKTLCCILVDKEEIGSVGATGMQSRFFENAVAELMNLMGEYSELNVRRCLARSCMLSSDVSAGFDPAYASCFEKKNAAFVGKGMVFNKFTGSRGKGGSNDANAEYIAYLRRILDEKGIVYQTAELGKVDVGGGGTIAYILA